jgi:hypothetical protein
MAKKAIKVEPRTIQFGKEMQRMELQGTLPGTQELAKILGVKSKSSVSEMKSQRQNIQPAQWKRFKEYFKVIDEQGTEHSVQDLLSAILRNQVAIMKKLRIPVPDKTRTKKP